MKYRNYKYRLPHYSERRRLGLPRYMECPSCKHKTFVPFIDAANHVVGAEYGICERRNNCGYFRLPPRATQEDLPPTREKYTYIPSELMRVALCESESAQLHEKSFFERAVYTITKHSLDDENGDIAANILYRHYYVTRQSIIKASGAKFGTAFWLVNENGDVCNAQLKDFGQQLKSSKDADGRAIISWLHTFLRSSNRLDRESRPYRCLFGQHLVKDDCVVHVYESPKTAIMATLWYIYLQKRYTGRLISQDEYPVCISALSLNGLRWLWQDENVYDSVHRFLLRARRIVLHPDLGAEREWQKDADEISDRFGCLVEVDLSLGDFATKQEIKDGLDWADFVFRKDKNLIMDRYLKAVSAIGI